MTPVHEHDTSDEQLQAIQARLEAERPVPAASFRGELRRGLLASQRSGVMRPRRLRLLVTAYGSSGLSMLAVAALGLAGVGPFGV